MPIGVSACPMLKYSVFYESHEPPPSGNASSILPPHCDGYQNGQQSWYILHCHCVDYCPGGRRGDTEQVVTQWRRPLASGEALDMLHWAMRSILYRHTAMAIAKARNGGAFVRRHRLF